MKNSTTFILLSLAFSTQGFASTWTEQHTYLAKINFRPQYYGKPIAGIRAHVGVVKIHNTCGYQGNEYWDNIHQIPMEQKGNHFFAKIVISDRMSECTPQILGLAVQYWVHFADGSQPEVSQSFLVPRNESRIRFSPESPEMRSILRSFEAITDSDRTIAEDLEFVYVS